MCLMFVAWACLDLRQSTSYLLARDTGNEGELATCKRLGIREIKALKPDETLWDQSLPGFGARRQKGAGASYVLLYRNTQGRQRWHTIGRHGAPWTPEQARYEAKRLLGEVVAGRDPVADKLTKRHAMSVTALCDLYLSEALQGRILKASGTAKKASTLIVDKGRIERHIKPVLGHYPVGSVALSDVDRLLHDVANGKTKAKIKTGKRGLANVRGGKTAANRVAGLLGAIFTFAVRQGMRPDNPVRGLQRFADIKRERRLSDAEYRALGAGLQKAEGLVWPPALAVIRFLALTGWRSGEALGLRWEEIDVERRTARLADTKSDQSVRPLSRPACDILAGLPRNGDLVFTSTRGDIAMSGFRKIWKKVGSLGGLPADITAHTLRHSFASLAADLGYSDSTIGAAIGHKGRSVTSRYVHSADAVLIAAADVVAGHTAELMGEAKRAAVVVEMPKRA